MAIDRCIAIVTPLKAGQIRVSLIQTKSQIDICIGNVLKIGSLFMWRCMDFSRSFIYTEYIYISFACQ